MAKITEEDEKMLARAAEWLRADKVHEYTTDYLAHIQAADEEKAARTRKWFAMTLRVEKLHSAMLNLIWEDDDGPIFGPVIDEYISALNRAWTAYNDAFGFDSWYGRQVTAWLNEIAEARKR